MSWTRQGGPSGPRSYHHGNLKETLIRAALALIAQKGLAGVTFAEAARWAESAPPHPIGTASLFGRGTAGEPLPMSAEDLLEAAVLIYLRGLGLSLAPTGNRSGG